MDRRTAITRKEVFTSLRVQIEAYRPENADDNYSLIVQELCDSDTTTGAAKLSLAIYIAVTNGIQVYYE